jgi:hypothetical protein
VMLLRLHTVKPRTYEGLRLLKHSAPPRRIGAPTKLPLAARAALPSASKLKRKGEHNNDRNTDRRGATGQR